MGENILMVPMVRCWLNHQPSRHTGWMKLFLLQHGRHMMLKSSFYCWQLAGSACFTINPRIWVCSENGGPQHHSFSLGKPLALGYPVGKPPFFWVKHASASALRRNAKHLRKSWTHLHGPRVANADPSCLTQPLLGIISQGIDGNSVSISFKTLIESICHWQLGNTEHLGGVSELHL